MMHPEMAKLYASQQQATPADEVVVYDITEFATADEWVEAKGKRGGLVARNKRSGRVLYGSRARAVLSRSRRRGGGGGSLFQKRSGFIGDINRKPGLTAGKATGVTRSRAKPTPAPTAKETLSKVLEETPDKPLTGKQVRAEVKDKKQTPTRGKVKVERRKETEKPAAIADDNAPGVSINDIPYRAAHDAYYWSSFTPERRAKQHQENWVAQMNADWQYLSKLANTPEKKQQLPAEWERYRKGYLAKELAWLHAMSRTASSMITGPANFPVERNRKRLETERKRLEEMLDFRKRALQAIKKKLSPETAAIQSNNPEAVQLLTKQLEQAKASQEQMKQANATIRKFTTFESGKFTPQGTVSASRLEYKKGKSREQLAAALAELGFSEKSVESLLTPDFAGRIGFPAYALTNNNANISRIEGRIKSLGDMKAGGHKEATYSGGVKVVEDPDAARIQIHFPGKPAPAVIAKLKSGGFRWSPSVGAWQRHLNNGGRYAVDSMLKTLGHTKESESEQGADAPEADDIPEMIEKPEPDDEEVG